jgi:hypothetical protein
MTRQGIEILLERVLTWPEEAQAEFVRSIADIEARHFGSYRLSDEERDAVRRGLTDMREGKFATDDESQRCSIVAVYEGWPAKDMLAELAENSYP